MRSNLGQSKWDLTSPGSQIHITSPHPSIPSSGFLPTPAPDPRIQATGLAQIASHLCHRPRGCLVTSWPSEGAPPPRCPPLPALQLDLPFKRAGGLRHTAGTADTRLLSGASSSLLRSGSRSTGPSGHLLRVDSGEPGHAAGCASWPPGSHDGGR